ncbi:MAG: hypothetical protein SGCHY_003373 [Lobulomycetales sp.]
MLSGEPFDGQQQKKRRQRRKKSSKTQQQPPLKQSQELKSQSQDFDNPNVWQQAGSSEREGLRSFWRSLPPADRKALLILDKSHVISRIKQQQRQACSCSVCGRKRSVVEDELEALYDAYYSELESAAPVARLIHNAPATPKITTTTVNDTTTTIVVNPNPLDSLAEFGSSLTVQNGVLTVTDSFLSNDGQKFLTLMDLLADRKLSAVLGGPSAPSSSASQQQASFTLKSSGKIIMNKSSVPGAPASIELNRTLSSASHACSDGYCSLEEDEYCDDHPVYYRPQRMHYHHHRHSTRIIDPQDHRDVADEMLLDQLDDMMDSDDYADYVSDDDDEDGSHSSDEYDDEHDEDDDEDSLGLSEEARMQEGRRMFQIFAAKLFEQRVFCAYRERIAAACEQQLIRELEAEEQTQREREMRKEKAKERKKAQKRAQKEAKRREEEDRVEAARREKAEAERVKAEKLEKEQQLRDAEARRKEQADMQMQRQRDAEAAALRRRQDEQAAALRTRREQEESAAAAAAKAKREREESAAAAAAAKAKRKQEEYAISAAAAKAKREQEEYAIAAAARAQREQEEYAIAAATRAQRDMNAVARKREEEQQRLLQQQQKRKHVEEEKRRRDRERREEVARAASASRERGSVQKPVSDGQRLQPAVATRDMEAQRMSNEARLAEKAARAEERARARREMEIQVAEQARERERVLLERRLMAQTELMAAELANKRERERARNGTTTPVSLSNGYPPASPSLLVQELPFSASHNASGFTHPLPTQPGLQQMQSSAGEFGLSHSLHHASRQSMISNPPPLSQQQHHHHHSHHRFGGVIGSGKRHVAPPVLSQPPLHGAVSANPPPGARVSNTSNIVGGERDLHIRMIEQLVLDDLDASSSAAGGFPSAAASNGNMYNNGVFDDYATRQPQASEGQIHQNQLLGRLQQRVLGSSVPGSWRSAQW